MNNDIFEEIEKINIISPIKEIITSQRNELGETSNVIVDEKIKLVQDEKNIEGNVILSFVAGEERRHFIAYTLDEIESKNDDDKVNVELGEIVVDEANNYYIASATEEDHKNIVVPAIIAIGNSNLSDPEEVEKNVRLAINDSNFSVEPLSSIAAWEQQYNNKEVAFKFKSSKPVLIPLIKLKVIKKIYIQQVNRMYIKAIKDMNKNLDEFEVTQALNKNDEKYEQIENLKEQFSNLPNSEKYEKDIEQLNELQGQLDSVKNIYDAKMRELGNIVEQEDNQEVIEPEVEEIKTQPEEILQQEDNQIQSDVQEEVPTQEEIVETKIEEPIQEEIKNDYSEQLVDKVGDVSNFTNSIVKENERDDEMTFKTEEDELKSKVGDCISGFNNEMDEFTKSLVEQLSEKYQREQEATVKSIRGIYEDYIKNLRTSLTENLDKYVLESTNAIAQLKNANEGLVSKLASTEKKYDEEKKENVGLRETINEKDDKIKNLNSKIEEQDKKTDEQEVTIKSLEKENDNKDTKIKDLELDNSKISKDNDELKLQIKAKDATIEQLNENLNKSEEMNSDYKKQLDKMSENMDDLRKNYEDYKKQSEAELESLKLQLKRFFEIGSNIQNIQMQMNEIASGYNKDENKEKTK